MWKILKHCFLYLYGLPFDAVIVSCSGPDLLFRSILMHCVFVFYIKFLISGNPWEPWGRVSNFTRYAGRIRLPSATVHCDYFSVVIFQKRWNLLTSFLRTQQQTHQSQKMGVMKYRSYKAKCIQWLNLQLYGNVFLNV